MDSKLVKRPKTRNQISCDKTNDLDKRAGIEWNYFEILVKIWCNKIQVIHDIREEHGILDSDTVFDTTITHIIRRVLETVKYLGCQVFPNSSNAGTSHVIFVVSSFHYVGPFLSAMKSTKVVESSRESILYCQYKEISKGMEELKMWMNQRFKSKLREFRDS